jgi:hypothetical protein
MREAKAVYLIGDVNYLEHGGMVVFDDGTADLIEPGEEEEESGETVIHRIDLDRVKDPSREWYGRRLREVARTVDVPLGELVAGLQSENLEDRAESYYDLIQFFGPDEFAQYPVTLSHEKAEKRYADVDAELREALHNPRDEDDDLDDDEEQDDDEEEDQEERDTRAARPRRHAPNEPAPSPAPNPHASCPRCRQPVAVTYSASGTERVHAHRCPHGKPCRAPEQAGPGHKPCPECLQAARPARAG